MLLTPKQVSEALNVSIRTVHRLMDDGKLPYSNITGSAKGRRIHPERLNEFIWQSENIKENGRLTLPTAPKVSGLDEILTPKRKQKKKKQGLNSVLKMPYYLESPSKKH